VVFQERFFPFFDWYRHLEFDQIGRDTKKKKKHIEVMWSFY